MKHTEIFRCPKCGLQGATLVGRENRTIEPDEAGGSSRLVSVCTLRCGCGHQFEREFGRRQPLVRL